jgi:hypothetical protein
MLNVSIITSVYLNLYAVVNLKPDEFAYTPRAII